MKDKFQQFIENLREQSEQLWRKQVLESQAVQQGTNWYNSQTARDQLIVKLLALLVVIALVFTLFYAPLIKDKKVAQQTLDKNLATYNLIASNAGRFGGAASSASASGSVLSAVTNQARAQGINLSRYEQDGANLRVWLDRVAFDEAITWLETLESKHAIGVSQISIDKTSSNGRVDIRATLGR